MKLNDSQWHEGRGAAFYRCELCTRPVSVFDIEKGGCQHCGAVRIRPTNLTTWEKVREICRNPRIIMLAFE